VPDWFTLLQTGGIIASILFTAITIRSDRRSRKASTLLQITQYHREIWSRLFDKPELKRIVDINPDLDKNPVTSEERLFVTLVIHHVNSVIQAIKAGSLPEIEGLERDITGLFALPIPVIVWSDVKKFQNKQFVNFIDNLTKSHSGRVFFSRQWISRILYGKK